MNKPLPPRYAKLALCMGLAFSGPLMAEQAASQADFLALQQAFNDFKSQTEQDLEQQQGTLGDIAVRMQAFEDKLTQLAADIAADQSAQAPVTDIQSISVPSTEYPSSPQLQHGCQTALKGAPIHTLQDALACLNTVQIAPTGEVHLTMVQQPADGVLYDTIYVQHPNGDRIFIEGDCAGADRRCTLNFKEGVRAFTLLHSQSIGSLSGFNLVGRRNNGAGVYVSHNSSAQINSLNITGFSYGLLVSRNSDAAIENIYSIDNQHSDIESAWDAHITGTDLEANIFKASYGGNVILTGETLIGEAYLTHLSQIHCAGGGVHIKERHVGDHSIIGSHCATKSDTN